MNERTNETNKLGEASIAPTAPLPLDLMDRPFSTPLSISLLGMTLVGRSICSTSEGWREKGERGGRAGSIMSPT